MVVGLGRIDHAVEIVIIDNTYRTSCNSKLTAKRKIAAYV